MSGKRRARRSDADRNSVAIIDAATELLGQGEDPSMAEVATRAGTTRQTVYAHFPNRDALLAAVSDRLTQTVATALAGVAPRDGTPAEALTRWLEASWTLVERHPALLSPALMEGGTDRGRHAPILGDLEAILRRAQDDGELHPGVTVTWAAAAIIALGHAAAAEVVAGRMDAKAAGAAYLHGARSVCLGVGAPS